MNITNDFLGSLLFSITVLLLVICGSYLIINKSDLTVVLLLFLYIPLLLSASITKLPITILTVIFLIGFMFFITPHIDIDFAYFLFVIMLLYIPMILFAYCSQKSFLKYHTSLNTATLISLYIILIVVISTVLQAWIFYDDKILISYHIKLGLYMASFYLNSINPNITSNLSNIPSIMNLLTVILPVGIVLFVVYILYSNLKIAIKIINDRKNYQTIDLSFSQYLPGFYNILFILVIFSTLMVYNFLDTKDFLLYILYQVSLTLWLGYAYCGIFQIKSYLSKQNTIVAILLLLVSIIFFMEFILLASFIGFFISIARHHKKLN